MRMLTIAILLVAAGTSMALAQGPGGIGIFADPAATDCDLRDDVAGIAYYCIVHVVTTGSTAARYAAPKPACFTGTFFTDQRPFPVTLGDSQTGVSVGYGSCMVGAIHTLTMVFFTSGTTPDCCDWSVVPDPQVPSGKIEAVDCFDNVWYPMGVVAIVNSSRQCRCGRPSPAEPSTWGRLKALYTE